MPVLPPSLYDAKSAALTVAHGRMLPVSVGSVEKITWLLAPARPVPVKLTVPGAVRDNPVLPLVRTTEPVPLPATELMVELSVVIEIGPTVSVDAALLAPR